MKFLALMGLAVIIQCASAVDDEKYATMEEVERGAPAEADAPLAPPQPEEDAGLGGSSELGGLDTLDGDDMLKIESHDGEYQLELKRKHVEMSDALKKLLVGDIHAGVREPLRLGERAGTGQIVEKIFKEYVKAHDGQAPEDELVKPIRSKNMAQIATFQNPEEKFSDAEFIDLIGSTNHANTATGDNAADISADGKHELFAIILAANYLDIKSLLHLGCAKVATVIKGQGPAEIKQILGNNNFGVVNGQIQDMPRAGRRRLSKDDCSILSRMFGDLTSF